MIIAFSGSHGTGKTTSAYRLAEELKINHPSKSVHALCNQARLCPLAINKKTTPESQLWIFTNQIQQEITLLSKFDILVCDRTPIDAMAYTYVAGFERLAMDMCSIMFHRAIQYQQIYFKSIKENEFCHSDGLRESKDRIFRLEVENAMLLFYDAITSVHHSIKITGLPKSPGDYKCPQM